MKLRKMFAFDSRVGKTRTQTPMRWMTRRGGNGREPLTNQKRRKMVGLSQRAQLL